MGVYGIGRSRALQFVMRGFRTLKDLLERGELNQSQRIGIELYDVPHQLHLSNNRISPSVFHEKK
jgi:hypothetical protein